MAQVDDVQSAVIFPLLSAILWPFLPQWLLQDEDDRAERERAEGRLLIKPAEGRHTPAASVHRECHNTGLTHKHNTSTETTARGRDTAEKTFGGERSHG